MAHSYRDAAATAAELGMISEDGVAVASQYLEQVWTLETGNNGMFITVIADSDESFRPDFGL